VGEGEGRDDARGSTTGKKKASILCRENSKRLFVYDKTEILTRDEKRERGEIRRGKVPSGPIQSLTAREKRGGGWARV